MSVSRRAPVVGPRNPRWIPSFLGRVPEGLEARQLRLLGLVSLGLAFENYDLALINTVIHHVSADLGMSVSRIGLYTGIVRAGGFATFLLVPFADRLGRRRVFLASLVGMSAATLATAFAQVPWQFAAAQCATRAFMLTAAAVGVVILSEETPAEHRGWALGMLGALAASGYGMSMLAFAFIDVLPFGWRALYIWGFLPVLMLPFFRREIAETGRFEVFRRGQTEVATGTRLRRWLEPMLRLARTRPLRAAAVGGAGCFAALGSIAVFQYSAVFLQRVHGWQPWQVSALVIGGGLLGIVGNPIAGRLSDRIGRRRVGAAAFGTYPLAVFLFFEAPELVLPLAWAAIVLFGTGGDVIVRVLATELFPTSHRGTAVGWLTLLQTIGWTSGLVVMSAFAVDEAHIGPRVAMLSLVVSLAGLCVLALPETHRLELERISQETSPPG